MLREAAPAKVNLFLHVTGRRPDGYHLLDSLAVFGPAQDDVLAGSGIDLSLVIEGEHAAGLSAGADNLVLRAARLLADAGGVTPRAALRLIKRLPVASGIGGGSADAAAALRLLNRAWGLAQGKDALQALAAKLGADVPVCVASRPARMQGIGDVLLPAPAVPACGLLLVNPGAPLATPAVFAARDGAFTPLAELPGGWPDAVALATTLAALGNDLEAPAIRLCPPIAAVLAMLRALPGCHLARMSGSGATCFGLFTNAAAAQRAAALVPPGWWRCGGGLYEAPAPSLHPAMDGV